MNFNEIFPAFLGAITALLTIFLSDRVKAKSLYKQAQNEAERVQAEKKQIQAQIETSIAEATDIVRTQLVAEIKRIQSELDENRALVNKQNKIIASIRLEASEMEARYKRRISDLEKLWRECQAENKMQQARYNALIQQLHQKIIKLGGTPLDFEKDGEI